MKSKIIKVCTPIFLLFLISSCYTPTLVYSESFNKKGLSKNEKLIIAELDQYIGKNTEDLIKAFGAHSREVTDGKNGKILVYEDVSVFGMNGGVFTFKSSKQFFINKNDTIYSWKLIRK